MKTQILLSSLALAALLASCNKDKVDYVNNSGPYTSLNQVYGNLSSGTSKFTVDATAGGTFTGPKGTVFILPGQSLLDLAGNPVTGNVDVEIREYTKVADMIFSKVLPISDDKALRSGGEVFFKASQNGQQLKFKQNAFYTTKIAQPGVPINNLTVFYGTEINTVATAPNTVNWAEAPKDSLQARVAFVTAGNDTVSIFCDSMGMVNADAFLPNPNYQTFTINITGVPSFDKNNFQAYALYDDYLAVWPMAFNTSGIINENHVPNAPVHFVIMGVSNGKFYGGMLGTTPTNNSTYTVNLVETTPQSFKEQIAAL